MQNILGGHDLQGQIWLIMSNFLVSPLLEIHNHHINTREPWVPRLHRPDCFTVFIFFMYLYTYTVSRSCFTVSTLCTYWSKQPKVFRRLMSLLLKSKTYVYADAFISSCWTAHLKNYVWNRFVILSIHSKAHHYYEFWYIVIAYPWGSYRTHSIRILRCAYLFGNTAWNMANTVLTW